MDKLFLTDAEIVLYKMQECLNMLIRTIFIYKNYILISIIKQ